MSDSQRDSNNSDGNDADSAVQSEPTAAGDGAVSAHTTGGANAGMSGDSTGDVTNEAADDTGLAAPTSLWHLFLVFLRLGCTSFGGPVAHLAAFNAEIVERRRWMDSATYADLVAFCQFLPGPASSQTGMGIGLYRAGLPGLLTAWTAFTLPTVVVLTVLAVALGQWLPADATVGWFRGIHAAVVAVVAWAVWSLGTKLCGGRRELSLAMVAAAVLIAVPGDQRWWVQLVVIALGGVIGALLLRREAPPVVRELPNPVGKRIAGGAVLLAVLVVVGIGIAAELAGGPFLGVIAALTRVGALVFGGGHVVLPMLEAEVVAPGWISSEVFLAGYGAANAMPGPLFGIAAWLGASVSSNPFVAIQGALLGTIAIFLPGMLLLIGLLPSWERLRRVSAARSVLAGVGASVVGLLIVALYDPVLLTVVDSKYNTGIDLAVALVAFAALAAWKVPAWLVVPLAALFGGVMQMAGATGWS